MSKVLPTPIIADQFVTTSPKSGKTKVRLTNGTFTGKGAKKPGR